MSDQAADLEAEFGHWGEKGGHPASDWEREVANGETRLGYWAWVAARIKHTDE